MALSCLLILKENPYFAKVLGGLPLPKSQKYGKVCPKLDHLPRSPGECGQTLVRRHILATSTGTAVATEQPQNTQPANDGEYTEPFTCIERLQMETIAMLQQLFAGDIRPKVEKVIRKIKDHPELRRHILTEPRPGNVLYVKTLGGAGFYKPDEFVTRLRRLATQ